jgi:hypothetical protein
MSYATLAEIKDWLSIDSEDETDDLVLTLCLDAASDNIDRYCDGVFEEPYPAGVVLACLIQATRYFKRRDAWAGTTGGINGDGFEIRLLSSLDSDVKLMLSPNRNRWWVAADAEESS